MNRGVLLVLLSAASFGMMPVLIKLASREGVGLLTLLTLRFCVAGAALWLIWGYRSRASGARGPARLGTLLPLMLMGGIGYVGQSFSYFTALGTISASATSLLLYTYPVLVTLLAWLFFRERLTARKALALGAATIGTLMVLGIISSVLGGRNDALGDLNPEGVSWALSAAMVYSAFIIAGTRFTSGLHPTFSSAVIISAAALVYTLWATVSEELDLNITPLGLVWAIIIALVCTVIAITTFFAGLGIVGPSRAAIISTVEPTFSVVLATLVLGEAITLEQAAGGGLILVAVLTLQYKSGAEQAQAKEPV